MDEVSREQENLADSRTHRRTVPWTWILVTLAITCGIGFARREILFAPAYYDFAVGIWPEAHYLARTNFDFHALRYDEPHCLDPDGGPRSYMTSIIPALLAVAMKILPTPTATIVAYHLFTFACAAVVAVLLYHLLRDPLGRVASCLAAAAALTTPVLCVQIDMTGMEMSLAAASMAVAVALQRKAYVWTALWALLAFFIKPSGSVLTVANLIVLAALVAVGLGGGWSRERTRQLLGLAANALALLIEFSVLHWGGSLGAQIRQGPPLALLFIWCPDYVLLALATLLGMGYFAKRQFFPSPTNPKTGSAVWSRLCDFVRTHSVLLFAALVFAGTLAAATRVSLVPRYLAVTVPFLYLIFGSVLRTIDWRARWIVLTAILSVNLWNWNGALYPDLQRGTELVTGIPGPFFAGEGSFLERSHEYLDDHRENLAAMETLREQCRSDAILAPIPFAYFLAFPEFGYGSEDLRGYSLNGFKKAAPWFGDFNDFIKDQPQRLSVVRCANFYSNALLRLDLPQPRPEDEILYQSPSGTVVVFRPKFETREEFATWLGELKFLATPTAASLYYLANTEGWTKAAAEASRLAESHPENADLRCLAAGFAAKAGTPAPAEIDGDWPHSPVLHEQPLPHGARDDTPFRQALTHALSTSDPDFEAGMTCLKYLDLHNAAQYFCRWLRNREA
jgi:hypothetical protein